MNTLSGPKVYIALFAFGGGGLEELQWYTTDTDALLWTIANIANMLPLDTYAHAHNPTRTPCDHDVVLTFMLVPCMVYSASNVYGAVVDATTENYYAVAEATSYYAQGNCYVIILTTNHIYHTPDTHVYMRVLCIGIVVIWTDGRDNAGVYLKDEAITAAEQSTSYVYSVASGSNGMSSNSSIYITYLHDRLTYIVGC